MASYRRPRRNSAFNVNFHHVRRRWHSDETASPSSEEQVTNGFDALGRAPVHLAAASGDCGTLRCLLAFAPRDTELTDLRRGATPLIWATVCGHIEIIELLLDAGANPNATDAKGYTALHYALAGYANYANAEEDDRAEQREYRQLCLLLLRTASAV